MKRGLYYEKIIRIKTEKEVVRFIKSKIVRKIYFRKISTELFQKLFLKIKKSIFINNCDKFTFFYFANIR